MELALVTGQRREDLADMGPRSVHDGKLWVEQGKTGAKVCIPLDLRLQAVNWSVGDVVERCRDNVLSRHSMAANSRSQTPSLDQRESRTNTLFQLPNSLGTDASV